MFNLISETKRRSPSLWIAAVENPWGPHFLSMLPPLISMKLRSSLVLLSKVMLKIFQARLQQYLNHGLPEVQAGFRKGTWSRDQIANICWIIKKAREFQKNIYFCFIDYTKAFVCIRKTGKLLKRWEYQTIWPASWEICMQVRKQLLELDMEQQTGSNSGKDYIKAIYCHPAYLTYMHCTSWEKLSWMKHKLESRLWGEISIISDMQMTPPLWQKAKKN